MKLWSWYLLPYLFYCKTVSIASATRIIIYIFFLISLTEMRFISQGAARISRVDRDA